MNYDRQAGQIGLMVLLIMVVLLTVGLSIVTRSTSDVSQSRQEEETSRVFNGAEAGIEEVLSQPILTTASNGNGSLAVGDVTVGYTIRTDNFLNVVIPKGHVVGVNVTGMGGTNVNIDWSKTDCSGGNVAAALVVSIFTPPNVVARWAYGPTNDCGRTDSFINVNPNTGSNGLEYRATVSIPAGATLMRIRTVYNDTELYVSGAAGFPIQQNLVDSEGKSNLGDETRQVQALRTLPVAPAIFDYVLFSGTDLTK